MYQPIFNISKMLTIMSIFLPAAVPYSILYKLLSNKKLNCLPGAGTLSYSEVIAHVYFIKMVYILEN